ncbi:hypothetical protein ACQJBY_066438 [Aegilops geniculata]
MPPRPHAPARRRRVHAPSSAAASTFPTASPPQHPDLASPPWRPALDSPTLHTSAASPPRLPLSASLSDAIYTSGLPPPPPLPEQLTRDEGVTPSAMAAGTAEKTSTLRVPLPDGQVLNSSSTWKRKNVEPQDIEDIEANAIDAETMGTNSSKEKEVVKGQSLAQFLKHLRRLLLHMIVQQRTQEVNNVLRRRAQEAKSCEPSCATTCYFVEHHAIWNLAV